MEVLRTSRRDLAAASGLAVRGPARGNRGRGADLRGSCVGCAGLALGVAAADLPDVGLGFAERGDAAVTLDGLGTRVVGGQSECQVVVVALEEFTEVLGTGVDVFGRVKDISYAKAGGGLRQQLH